VRVRKREGKRKEVVGDLIRCDSFSRVVVYLDN
jgi:hypothetical protein